MSFFRRKKDASKVLPRTSSLSVYGQGRKQALQNAKNSDKLSDSGSYSSFELDDRPHPLAFAEATFEPSLPIKTTSRLSKDFPEVLSDNGVLAYFIQFMDARRSKHLVKFWLEAESFRVSTETRAGGDAERKKVLGEEERLPVPPSVAGSGSSGYLSDKSDDVFHSSSSQANSSQDKTSAHPSVDVNSNCTEKTSGAKNGSLSNNSPVNKNADSKCGENCDTNSGLERTVQQNSSVDSGCEEKSGDLVPSVGTRKELSSGSNAKEPESGSRTSQSDEAVVADGVVKKETSTEQDALAIFSTYIAENASSPIGISSELGEIIKGIIFKSGADIDPKCFVPAQKYVVEKMENEFYPHFLRSSFHCKYQIDVLTSGTVYFADVLFNESALFFFMEFVEQEGVRHFVDFLLMADNFQKHLLSPTSGYDGLQAQTDAMVLYDKYFSLQASVPLGFSDPIRFEVEANICQDGGPLPDCFAKPVNILTQYLEKTFLLQFLHSQLYFKYISECIISIQNDGADSASQSKYAASDSGSEKSLPVPHLNTLLAMEQKGAAKVIRNIGDQDMRIDTRQFDPDALWQKKVSRKLQMAHVDHLGRVTTDFEPDPEKQKESKISKAVKKLVNWEEDKNQEEMAWKVAEMIVKDICSVTMPVGGSSPIPSHVSENENS